MSSTDEFNWRATFSTLRIKVNVMPPYRKYSTPERLERIRASKRRWAKRNASHRRQKNKEYNQRPEYAEQKSDGTRTGNEGKMRTEGHQHVGAHNRRT